MVLESNKISVLITHYNRIDDLLLCIHAIQKINLPNYEIVVSDDGSDPDVINQLENASNIDKLVLANENQGLAANINKGLKACGGTYIIYCQEDFLLSETLQTILPEAINLLETKKVDLVRFTSYFEFNKLNKLSERISLIPKFSFRNFLQNYYRYSDHPFITTNSFHPTYGYYQEGTSGRYGETEYAIRIFRSNAKIAMTNTRQAHTIEGSQSMLINEFVPKKKQITFSKPILKWARAFRLYFEWAVYNKNKRGLLTYTNGRKN